MATMVPAISDPSEAVRQQIIDTLRDRSQSWLGIEVARIEGRTNPFTQPAVSAWIARPENQPPDRIFSIEKALGRKPGSLSRLLGYVPAASKPATSVEAAIEADPRLDSAARGFLIDSYRAAVKRGG